ncbi:MAG TPA: DoxX family protein [Kofleriaceae bacterium]|nr:DoxX family protein [Kofleriaceae bacterium]
MKKNITGYWVTLGLFAAVYTFSSIMDLTGVGPARATMAHLGYPAYVGTILGVWKAGAVVTLLSPRLARLKEWAYAGIVFDLTGGFVSHLATGDALPKPLIPLVLLALALTSYALRPASRRLEAAPAEPRGVLAPAR